MHPNRTKRCPQCSAAIMYGDHLPAGRSIKCGRCAWHFALTEDDVARPEAKPKPLDSLPVGIEPRDVHRFKRIVGLTGAVARHHEAGIVPDLEWVEELAELIRRHRGQSS